MRGGSGAAMGPNSRHWQCIHFQNCVPRGIKMFIFVLFGGVLNCASDQSRSRKGLTSPHLALSPTRRGGGGHATSLVENWTRKKGHALFDDSFVGKRPLQSKSRDPPPAKMYSCTYFDHFFVLYKNFTKIYAIVQRFYCVTWRCCTVSSGSVNMAK